MLTAGRERRLCRRWDVSDKERTSVTEERRWRMWRSVSFGSVFSDIWNNVGWFAVYCAYCALGWS